MRQKMSTLKKNLSVSWLLVTSICTDGQIPQFRNTCKLCISLEGNYSETTNSQLLDWWNAILFRHLLSFIWDSRHHMRTHLFLTSFWPLREVVEACTGKLPHMMVMYWHCSNLLCVSVSLRLLHSTDPTRSRSASRKSCCFQSEVLPCVCVCVCACMCV